MGIAAKIFLNYPWMATLQCTPSMVTEQLCFFYHYLQPIVIFLCAHYLLGIILFDIIIDLGVTEVSLCHQAIGG